MKVILVLCVVILSHQKISLANYLRTDNLGKSSLSTEYQARFHQLHCDGVNVSEGNIAGNHHFQKSTSEEPWESFASKCASIIHGLVSALTSAVAPAPGDAMNLELDIKNHIFHHDDRQFNSCKPAGALPDCGNVPSTALGPSTIPGEGQTLSYPSNGGILPPQNNYLSTGVTTLRPGIVYGDNAQQLPLSQLSEDYPFGSLPIEASPAPEPTMNTPATQEASCETTTPNFSSVPDFQNPLYTMPNDNELSNLAPQNNLIDGSQSFPSDILPLDNWKPCSNHQTDLISPGSALTDDCSTSPHLAPGLATPASFPAGNPSPSTYTWDKFYNENPDLISSNSLPNSRASSPTENPEWPSGFNWDTYPNQQPDYLPPASFNDDSSNAFPSNGLVTPVSPVTDCPAEDICHSQQLAYLAPVEGENAFSNIIPGNNFDAPIASGNDCLPEDTYTNQQPGFVPPFEGSEDLSNIIPGDNFGAPSGSVKDCPFEDTCPSEQPGFVPPGDITNDISNTVPGDVFGAPVGPGINSLPEDTYPNQQKGYLTPDIGYGDGAVPGQNINNPAGGPANFPLENTYSQELGYFPPLPPPSFNDVSSNIIPSDSLVTQTPPVTDFPFESGYQNQEPGNFLPQSFGDGLSNNLPDQSAGEPVQAGPLGNDNLGLYPNQQPGRLPLPSSNDASSNAMPGQNLDGPLESVPFGSDNWGPFPNQQPGRLPPPPFNDGFSNNLPDQSPGEPLQSSPIGGDNWSPNTNQQPGSFPPQFFDDGFSNPAPGQNLGGPIESDAPGSDNWDPFPNQQPGRLPPQSFNDVSSNTMPGQNLDGPLESGAPGGDNWGAYPNQQPGSLPPQSFDDGFSNPAPGQNLGGPIESDAPGSDNWDPFPNQQPGSFPPQSFNDGFSNNLPDQSPGEPLQSSPVGDDTWSPNTNQQPGSFPPQSFDDGFSNPAPGQNLGGPIESDAPGSDNWGPYPNQQPGRLPPLSFNQGLSNALPVNNLPSPNSLEPDNSLQGTKWDPSSQNQPNYLYGMNNPANFIPSDNIETPSSPVMFEPGTNSGNSQQSPLPPESEGFNDVPYESNPSDQQIPEDAVTKPNFNHQCTSDNNDNRPCTADSNAGYDQDYPLLNNGPLGINYPAGDTNVEAEEPMIPPGMFEPPALESANQLSEPYPNEGEQIETPGFSGQELGQYPTGKDYIPETTSPVPEYITPSYDDAQLYYDPEMQYQGPDDYGSGQSAVPNGLLQKPIQIPPGYQNGLSQGNPNYYDVPASNQGWSPNAIYPQPEYGPPPPVKDPSAIYIPVDPDQSVLLSDPNQDHDSDESCACDDCYYDDVVDQKAFRKTACRDLEEARDELKAIFDKIKKKLKCTQRNKCFGNI